MPIPADPTRRRLLGLMPAALLWAGGLLGSSLARAADLLSGALAATRLTDALRAYGAASPTASAQVSVNADELAERGDNVRVVVNSTVPGADSIAIFADRNPLPLAAVFRFGPDAQPFVSAQLKLAETTNVRAVVRAPDGRHLEAARKVTVTISGCA